MITKEISREDERKLYEAYEALDRILNGKSTLQCIINEKIDLIMDKLERDIRCYIIDISQVKQYYEASNLAAKIMEDLKKYRVVLKYENNA